MKNYFLGIFSVLTLFLGLQNLRLHEELGQINQALKAHNIVLTVKTSPSLSAKADLKKKVGKLIKEINPGPLSLKTDKPTYQAKLNALKSPNCPSQLPYESHWGCTVRPLDLPDEN